jgi:CHAD domain-containing protein
MPAPALLALPPELAVQRLALAQLDAAAKACARVARRDDAEALHDFRVALRRLRSLLRAYAPWTDPVPKHLRKRLRRLARATNLARDVEVQIEWLSHAPLRLKADAGPGRVWLRARLAHRQRTITRALRKRVSKEFAALEPRLRKALRTGQRWRAGVADAGVTFAQATGVRLSEYCVELAADLAGVGSAADRDAIHAARIGGKRLRYLLEPLRGSVSGAVAPVNAMKAFQDRFGELCDRFVTAREIAQAVEIAGAQTEPVLPGLHALAAWVECDINRRYRDIRARYLGRHARTLLAPMRVLNGKLAAVSDTQPRRVRLK